MKKRTPIKPLATIILCALLLVSFLRTDETGPRLGQENSAWVQSMYFRGYRTKDRKPLERADFEELAKNTRKYNFRYGYFFSGPYQKDGSLPGYATSPTARDSVRLIKSLNPELKILPWLGGLQDRTVFLNDEDWVNSALESTIKIVDLLEVPGVHINFEYVPSELEYVVGENVFSRPRSDITLYAAQYNSFLRRLRERLPDIFISTVVPATAQAVSGWKSGHSLDELAELALYVDQIAFMFYDTGIKDQATYEGAITEQLSHIRLTKKTLSGRNVQFLMGVGSFVNAPELQHFRSLEIEGIENHLGTLRRVETSLQLDRTPVVDGIALYSEWETDATEWKELNRHWTGQK